MYLLVPLAVALAGAASVVQVGMNAALRHTFSNAILAATVNFGVGFLFLLCINLLQRPQLPSSGEVASTPWWAWSSGVVGALFVATVAWGARDLGAVLTVTLIIVGQLLASTIIDHWGLVGFPQQLASPSRIIGCVVLMLGAYLIKRG